MAVSDYLKGTGASSDPYLIHNKAAMIEWLTVGCSSQKFAVIVSDIEMGFYSFGNGLAEWAGNLDGRGHTIKDLFLEVRRNFTGVMKNVTFFKLRVVGGQIYNGNTGGIVSDICFIDGSGTSYFMWAYNTIMTRVVSNSPVPVGCEVSGSTSIFALPGSGGMGSKSTDLRNHPTPYIASNFPGMLELPSLWVVDGASMPRLIKQNVSNLTPAFMVKGTVRVGGANKARFVRALSAADFARINDAPASANGEFSINCGLYSDAVMVATYEPYGSLPAGNKPYVVGDIIHPVTPNGFRYLCTKAGTSAATLPAEPWPTAATLTLGSAIFTPDPVYQPQLHGPIKPVLIDLVTGLPV